MDGSNGFSRSCGQTTPEVVTTSPSFSTCRNINRANAPLFCACLPGFQEQGGHLSARVGDGYALRGRPFVAEPPADPLEGDRVVFVERLQPASRGQIPHNFTHHQE